MRLVLNGPRNGRSLSPSFRPIVLMSDAFGSTRQTAREYDLQGIRWSLQDSPIMRDGSPARHFRISEFIDDDSPSFVLIAPRLVTMLERLRSDLGDNPITITSAFRTWATHERIYEGRPGEPPENSAHLIGAAADIVVRGVEPLDVALAADRIGFAGVGHYPSKGFTHVDTAAQDRRWPASFADRVRSGAHGGGVDGSFASALLPYLAPAGLAGLLWTGNRYL